MSNIIFCITDYVSNHVLNKEVIIGGRKMRKFVTTEENIQNLSARLTHTLKNLSKEKKLSLQPQLAMLNLSHQKAGTFFQRHFERKYLYQT